MSLVEQICVLPVLWELATRQSVSHILDFGPGGASGIGGLTHRNKEGTGVQVILANAFDVPSKELLDKSAIFDQNSDSIRFAPNWGEKYRPKLIRVASTNQVHIDTSFSRLLGKPPLMVAGMTPCTMDERFVSAVINAGYHIELAGGGQHTEQYLRNRVSKILDMVGPGEGVTLNILFLNPRLWGFQYPATMAMRKEGIPMEGICVAAGVPSLDVADEIVGNLKNAGIRHVAFKPGGVDTIRRVIAIAQKHPDMPVILQWTGGRGGGHHSFEDFHSPMLETYAAIRRVPNITLVVGSGFGDADGTVPYLTGEWSVEFDYAPMPFDGVLFGSRVMVAKEALTSQSIKKLIVEAPGITDESQWERTYKGPIGGVVTVKSELGEPIHKIANKGVMFWKEMDDTILSLPREKRLPALLAKKDYIISKLNSDFQKPWFGRKANGKVCDLHEMTYKEVADRMIALLYVKHQARWIDVTHMDTVTDFLRRVEERFNKTETVSLIQTDDALKSDPISFSEALFEAYPEAVDQTLTQEDVFHFLSLCSIPWRKPVTFIPVFDDKFEFWLKKDSLWQSEDVDAVVDQDPDRVAILQGPVAVAHSKIVDEPVADILGNIYKGQIAAIKKKYYNDSEAMIPIVEYMGTIPSAPLLEAKAAKVTTTVLRDTDGTTMMYEVPRDSKSLPSVDDWIETLAGPEQTWLRALLTTSTVVRGKSLSQNPIVSLVRPRAKQTVFVKLDTAGKPQVLSVYSSRNTGSVPSRHAALVISIEDDRITVTISERRGTDYVPLKFFFTYKPHQGYAPIHEDMEGRNQRIKDFYASLWNVELKDSKLKPTDKFTSSFTVPAQMLQDFIHIVGNKAERYNRIGESCAPMDFGIVAGWRSIVTAILPKEVDGDLLRLVHLGNEFKVLSNEYMSAGDVIDSTAIVNAITLNESGKTVEVKATLSKNGKPILEIISRFLYRGKFTDYENSFRRTAETPLKVQLGSVKDVAVLKSKTWIDWNSDAPEIVPGTTLIFRLDTFARNKSSTTFSELKTTGSVQIRTTRETYEIGRVNYEAQNCHGNVVLDYLQRVGSQIELDVFFSGGGYSVLPDPKVFPATVIVPTSNEAYAQASLDLNPIHVNPYFADLANLPGTITHGMWTSASTRKFVEIFAANNVPERVKEYSVTFMGMVLPGDELETKLSHIGMSNGKKLIKITTSNKRGEIVLQGSAKVEQPTTAFVFTGQGSQEVGMGMDLYSKSAIAKEIWDRADAHMLEQYGVSILEIVRSNPLQKTVHFGGIKGAAMRSHYRQLMYETVVDGKIQSLPLFPAIQENTPSYTFSHPSGLLSATQFTQPALTLMEFASFQDMKANGVVPSDCVFAGHSLGEYAGLSAVGETLSIEALVDVVFYRGMTMQVAVPRDALGRSDYGMCAVNPIRVSNTFGDQALVFVVNAIARRSSDLLEIVNFNVENFQYVLAGSLTNLDVLRRVLNKIKGLNMNFAELVKTKTISEIEVVLDGICDEAIASAKAQIATSGRLVPERGVATIPLPGIDVPFHSSFLLNGVTPFREILRKSFNPTKLNVSLLLGKYIPNLTAKPFALTKEYFLMVYDQTQSPPIKKTLDEWDDAKNSTSLGQQYLGYTLIVELLAYQFASPVRWIETQDLIFKSFEVERLIEVGPSPVLSGMAIRTLKMKYEAYDDAVTRRRVQLCTSKDRKDIYYEFEDVVAVEEPSIVQATPSPSPVAVVAPVVSTSSASASAVSDAAISAAEILFALIAQKLKKPLAEVSPTKSIKDLVGGKSTLQNEILGDLGAEFGNVLAEKAEELPLKEVASALQNSHSGSLGKTSSSLIGKLVSGKMPAGFGMNSVKAHLKGAFGLGPKRSEGVLVHGLTMEPASRFSSESEAKAWLDSVAQGYSAKVGVALGSAAAATPTMSVVSGPVAAAAGPIADVPLSASEVLFVLIANKLKKPLAEVSPTATIKSLVGGKSTLQNEILGDLGAEFGNVLADKAEELPLGEISSAIQNNYPGVLGKTSNGLISKLISGKMPAGFGMNAVKAHLSSSFGIGPKRAEGVLLHGLTMEPASRLGSESEAKSWIDSVASAYAAKAGISLGGSSSSSGASVGGGPVMNSEEFNLQKLKTDILIRSQLEQFAKYLDVDLLGHADVIAAGKKERQEMQKQLDLWSAEHGDFYEGGIKPAFTKLKVRTFDSSWNWARQDALQLYYDIIFGRITSVDRELMNQVVHLMNRTEDYEGLISFIEYYVNNCPATKGENYARVQELGKILLENCKAALKSDPVYKNLAYRPTQPKTVVTDSGSLVYKEERRPATNMKEYVKDMKSGSELTRVKKSSPIGLESKFEEMKAILDASSDLDADSRKQLLSLFGDVKNLISDAGSEFSNGRLPFIHLKRRCDDEPSKWEPDASLTELYFNVLASIASDGITFKGKT
ncbi:3-oxoacyl-[acyl-carrier-protein] synthase, partial [Entophlyctis luteolus]